MKQWVEKVHANPTEELTCGDRVYYVDHQAKGYGRWRTGLILQRKQDYEYSSGIRRAHGYDIYNIENCTIVSKTRPDIRKFKHTKAERKILEVAHKHLSEMIKEFMRDDTFRTVNSAPPVEFELTDYDSAVKNAPIRPDAPPPNENIPATENKSPEPQIEAPVIQTPPEAIPEQTSQPRKEWMSRELKNLKSELNGPSWECKETQYGWCLRVRTTGIEEEEEFKDA